MATAQALYQIAIANLSKDDFYLIFQTSKVYAEFKFSHKSSGYQLLVHNDSVREENPYRFNRMIGEVQKDIKRLRNKGLLVRDYLFEGRLM